MPKSFSYDDLYNQNSKFQQLVETIANQAISQIHFFLCKQPLFTGELLPLNRVKNSGLTHKAGLYLLFCPKTNKIYIGSTGDLAQRKGEHTQSIQNPNAQRKIVVIEQDIQKFNLGREDFQFVVITRINPVLSAEIANECSDNIGNNDTKISFFYLMVEETILRILFKDPKINQFLYNSKTTSAFQKGNSGGAHGKGGAPKKPVANNFGAWESVSLAAKYNNNVSKKTIRNWIKSKKDGWCNITLEEFKKYPIEKQNQNCNLNNNDSI
jgi:hypothetical protein